jgi:hypothetical protein
VDAILLIDWHLVLFEVKIGDALLEDTFEKIMGKFVLVGEAGGWNGAKPGEKTRIRFVALHNGFERILRKSVVVAIVAESCGSLRKVAEVGFVLLVEKRILRGEAVCNGFGVLGEEQHCDGNYKKHGLEGTHN